MVNPALKTTDLEPWRLAPSLGGCNVWITGAGSGIGRAIAVCFAAAGARVALTGRRVEALEETAAQIGEAAIVAPADVTDADQVAQVYHGVSETLSSVDILVNNAGRNSPRRHLRQLTVEDMASLLEVNLRTAFLCSLAVLPAMRLRKAGTLIHIGSMAATMVFPMAGAAYAAAKSAVRQMSAHINAEEGIYGIRSVCINPGEVATEIMAARPKPPSLEEQAIMLQPEDIAAAALFCATLPRHATISELTIVPTDNQAWRSSAQAIAQG